MSNQPDTEKRARVRKILSTKEGQQASDREVARQAEVSRTVVETVRRQMIASGQHPPKTFRPVSRGDKVKERVYKAGSPARGGYVYDENGNTVRETVWLERQKAKKSGKKTTRSK